MVRRHLSSPRLLLWSFSSWLTHTLQLFSRISRDVTTLDSKFHLFTSHFFTTLSSGGPEAVASWTRRKKINIFKKRLIFIPINKQMHWSLCVIVNPGALVEGGDRPRTQDDPLSCMIFMDSLRMHNKKIVARHVRKWLNSEWQRVSTENLDENSPSIVKEPFRGDSFRMFCPKGTFDDAQMIRQRKSCRSNYTCSSPSAEQHLGLWRLCLSICLCNL